MHRDDPRGVDLEPFHLREQEDAGGTIEHMRRGPKPIPGMTTDELMALTRGD